MPYIKLDLGCHGEGFSATCVLHIDPQTNLFELARPDRLSLVPASAPPRIQEIKFLKYLTAVSERSLVLGERKPIL